MTDFEFFTNSVFTDRSVLAIYDSLEAQNNYFDSLPKETREGIFKGFDSPILIHADLETCLGLSYFRFKRSDKWYYAVVTDVREDTPNKCWVSFRLDVWQTARHQFSAQLGRGYISRSSLVAPCATPYNAKYYKFVKKRWISNRTQAAYQVWPDIIFFARKSSTNDCRVGYIRGPFNDNELSLILNGKWMEYLRPKDEGNPYWTAADIQGAWFTPPIIDITQYPQEAGWLTLSGRDGNFANKTIVSIFPSDSSEVRGFANLYYEISKNDLNEFITDNTHTTVVKDLEGNIIYQFDFGRTFNDKLRFDLSVSPTSCKWLVRQEGSEPINFTFPCSTLDVFTDSYVEYFARERDFDISTRELNNKKTLISGVSGGAAGAVSGAVTGALLGSAVPGIGTAIGAVAGLGAGIIGGAITSGTDVAVNNYFNPQEQAIKDDYYKNAIDPLSIIGSNLINFLFIGTQYSGIFEYEIDADTKARIESDITTFGQYTTRAVASGESYLSDGAKLKGEFIVKGDMPENWKAEIQRTIAAGVQIRKLGA